MTYAIEEEFVVDDVPSVTVQEVHDSIAEEFYFTGNEALAGAGYLTKRGTSIGLMTFCVLVLNNGFTVVGESVCVSPKKFNLADGRRIAKQKAMEKVWPLLGYALKSKLKEANG